MLANSGHVMGIISAVALSFIVQLPNEIMEWFSARSLSSKPLRYRSICDSDLCVLKTECGRKSGRPGACTSASASKSSGTGTWKTSPRILARSSRDTVSPNDTPTSSGPKTRRLKPASCARAATAAASMPDTVTVSNAGVEHVTPPALSAAEHADARPRHRRAMSCKPSGPW